MSGLAAGVDQGKTIEQHMSRIEALLDQIDAFGDPEARAVGLETVETLLQIYGEGLRRIVGLAGDSGGGLLAGMTGDDLVSHLLILHDLHPDDVATRVRRALEELGPQLASRGADVGLVSVAGGTAHLELQGGCGSCSGSLGAVGEMVEQSVLDAAPELGQVVVDEGRPSDDPGPAIIPLSSIGRAGAAMEASR